MFKKGEPTYTEQEFQEVDILLKKDEKEVKAKEKVVFDPPSRSCLQRLTGTCKVM